MESNGLLEVFVHVSAVNLSSNVFAALETFGDICRRPGDLAFLARLALL